MDGWKIYTSEYGVQSLECSDAEERIYYRMKIFIRNYFSRRCRDREEPVKTKSFIFQLVNGLKGKKEDITVGNNEDPAYEIFIDGTKVVVSWNQVMGLSITPEKKEGNRIVQELCQELKRSDCFI